jgi:hypothetical protein
LDDRSPKWVVRKRLWRMKDSLCTPRTNSIVDDDHYADVSFAISMDCPYRKLRSIKSRLSKRRGKALDVVVEFGVRLRGATWDTSSRTLAFAARELSVPEGSVFTIQHSCPDLLAIGE